MGLSPLLRRWLASAAIAVCVIYLLTRLSSLGSILQTRVNGIPGESEQIFGLSQMSLQKPVLDTEIEPFNWANVPTRNPVTSMIPLPTGKPAEIPQIQHDFRSYSETSSHKAERLHRLAAVKEAFMHSWTGYRANAWLHDEVKPLSGAPFDPFGGWGATLVDTLDTLWIMGLEKDFAVAVAALEKIDFSRGNVKDINVFETTIRYLGGFLAAYDLSGGTYPLLLRKAIEVAEMLYRAFDTSNRMPITRWDWQKYLDGAYQDTPTSEVVAELGSLTMEFTRLSQITGNPKYFDAVQRISNLFAREQNNTKLPGLWPLMVNPLREDFLHDNTFTVGGMADSVFEYLPKTYLLLQGRDPMYAAMHLNAVAAVKKHLAFEALLAPSTLDSSTVHIVSPSPPLFLGTVRFSYRSTMDLDPRSEHLTCFAGGMIGLAARALSSTRSAAETAEDMDVALRLTQGCLWSYSATPTQIGPEIYKLAPCRTGRDAVTNGIEPDHLGQRGDCTWDRKLWLASVQGKPRQDRGGAWQHFASTKHLERGFTSIPDSKYILRPEAIESVFVMWRITGNEALQDAAWAMFEAIVKHTRTDIAFAALSDVMWSPREEGDMGHGSAQLPPRVDGMESFWTAETLKYFYLVFAETDVVSLDEFVFNTEAHPFRWKNGKK